MNQVKQKLHSDGKDAKLFESVEVDKVLRYKISTPFTFDNTDTHEKYNSIIQGVVEYFDLFKQNADKLEHII
jgi:hypothetical protein